MIIFVLVLVIVILSYPILDNPISDKTFPINTTFFFSPPSDVFRSSIDKELTVNVLNKPSWMRNFKNPSSIASYSSGSGERGSGVFVVGNYCYFVSTLFGGLSIIDITKKSSPKLVGFLETLYSMGIHVDGDYAYVADQKSGLKIISIKNKADPKLVGIIDTPYARGVFISGNFAYIADNTGLIIGNITNKENPKEVGSLEMENDDWVFIVKVVGDYAYVANNQQGLKIIDIKNKTNPKEVGSLDLDTNGKARGLDVVGDYAYVSEYDGEYGFNIVDISNVTNPYYVSRIETPAEPQGVYVSGNYAYLAETSSGLVIVDITNKTKPELYKAVYFGGRYAYTVFVKNGFVYVGTTRSRLEIVSMDSLFGPCLFSGVVELQASDGDGYNLTDSFIVNCTCPGGWIGMYCRICTINCKNEGNHDEDCTKCNCVNNWEGEDCSGWNCGGVDHKSKDVCSGRGKCDDPEVCKCEGNWDKESWCANWTCGGIDYMSDKVCSGHGKCLLNETLKPETWCECDKKYTQDLCSDWTCYDKDKKAKDVCDGHGACEYLDHCQCIADYSGLKCDDWQCYGNEKSSPAVCSGHGVCVSFDKCECTDKYTGNTCSVEPKKSKHKKNLLWADITFPILALVLVCCCCCFLIIIGVVIVVVVVVGKVGIGQLQGKDIGGSINIPGRNSGDGMEYETIGDGTALDDDDD